MNFYNPYTNFIPYSLTPARTGFLRNILGNLSFRNIVSGTQKTLNFVNQVIPAVKQISPIVKNAKTMFKVMNEFKKGDNTPKIKTNTPSKTINNNSYTQTNNNEKNNVPTFFL